MPTEKNPKNVALAKQFTEALDKKTNYTPRELADFNARSPESTLKQRKELPGQFDANGNPYNRAPDEEYEKLKAARDKARIAYENGRDVHINARKNGWGHAAHFIDEVSTSQGFNEVNARRASLGLKPLNVPNPDKIEMKPKEPEKPPVAGLQKPAPAQDIPETPPNQPTQDVAQQERKKLIDGFGKSLGN